jgi:hypothetical protein
MLRIDFTQGTLWSSLTDLRDAALLHSDDVCIKQIRHGKHRLTVGGQLKVGQKNAIISEMKKMGFQPIRSLVDRRYR